MRATFFRINSLVTWQKLIVQHSFPILSDAQHKILRMKTCFLLTNVGSCHLNLDFLLNIGVNDSFLTPVTICLKWVHYHCVYKAKKKKNDEMRSKWFFHSDHIVTKVCSDLSFLYLLSAHGWCIFFKFSFPANPRIV